MRRMLLIAGLALLGAPAAATAGDGHNCFDVDDHSDHDSCECSVDVEFYSTGPAPGPIRVKTPAYRVSGRPVSVPGPVVYIEGPPIYVDAPPVRVAPAQIYVQRPEVVVRPSQVIVEPPVVHTAPCPDGTRCTPARPRPNY